MTTSASTAKKLLNKAEFELFKASSKSNLKTLTPFRLKQKADRARKLRDKWREQANRQQREARGKGKPRGKSPAKSAENTLAKARIFDELLTAFQGAAAAAMSKGKHSSVADKRSGVPKSVRGGKHKGEAKGAAGETGAAGSSKVKPASRAKRVSKKAAANKANRMQAGVMRTLGHMSSADKRNQGSRDLKSARARGG